MVFIYVHFCAFLPQGLNLVCSALFLYDLVSPAFGLRHECVGVHTLGDAGKFRVVVLCWVVTQTGFVSSGGAAGRASRKAHGLECQEWGG